MWRDDIFAVRPPGRKERWLVIVDTYTGTSNPASVFNELGRLSKSGSDFPARNTYQQQFTNSHEICYSKVEFERTHDRIDPAPDKDSRPCDAFRPSYDRLTKRSPDLPAASYRKVAFPLAILTFAGGLNWSLPILLEPPASMENLEIDGTRCISRLTLHHHSQLMSENRRKCSPHTSYGAGFSRYQQCDRH